MNLLDHILPGRREAARKAAINARLKATLKPNPGLRAKRLAQMSAERAARYRRNIAMLGLDR